MSYGIFNSTIETLAEATVPTGPLDRNVLDGISGADYGALMSGLRFLGLVDEHRKATAEYRELIQLSKRPKEFKEHLGALIILKYAPIIGDLDLDAGTLSQLEKAFRDAGVQPGQMLTKSVRFLIKALTEAGIKVSAYMTKPKPRVARASAKKTGGKQARRPPLQGGEIPAGPPKGFDRMPVPGLPSAFIQFPLDLTPEQVDLFGAVVNVLRTFAKGKSGKQEEIV
jgi:hypothetical protein